MVLDQYLDDAAVKLFILKNLYRDEQGQFQWRINVPVLQRCYEQMRAGLVSDHVFDGDALFIKGGNSPYVQERHWPATLQLFPRAHLQTVAGAGHWLHAEKSDEFNRLVLEFLL